MKNKLLEKALSKQAPSPMRVSDDAVGLALAWMKDEISMSQANFALTGGKGSMSIYVDLARGIRQAYRNGKLKVLQ